MPYFAVGKSSQAVDRVDWGISFQNGGRQQLIEGTLLPPALIAKLPLLILVNIPAYTAKQVCIRQCSAAVRSLTTTLCNVLKDLDAASAHILGTSEQKSHNGRFAVSWWLERKSSPTQYVLDQPVHLVAVRSVLHLLCGRVDQPQKLCRAPPPRKKESMQLVLLRL